MKITFFSNFLNHHQLPFSLEMVSQENIEYTFVATEPIHEERLLLGFVDMNKQYDFVLTTYDSEENLKKALDLAVSSDVVIHGSAPKIYVDERMKYNKLTFRYSERIYKEGRWRAFTPRNILSSLKNHTRYGKKELYMLCASGYTCSDFSLLGAYKNKCFKWGYFPEVIPYNVEALLEKKPQEKIKILWCARFIKCKHPESMIFLAEKLKNNGYNFEIEMIGNGVLYPSIKEDIEKHQLQNEIKLLGSMTPVNVRSHMEKANIFCFTSDYNEGWGAVLNESMSSGCAVVCSHAIGSACFLIKNGENGLIYQNDSIDDLYKNVVLLIENKELRETCGKNAYKTLNEVWNAKTASENLIKLSLSLLEGKKVEHGEEPCHIALNISQEKMYQHICSKEIDEK